MSVKEHLVIALGYDGLCTFEFGIAVEVFALPRPEFDFPWYRFVVYSIENEPLKAVGGVQIAVDGTTNDLDRADTIIVPGWRSPSEIPPVEMIDIIKRAYDRGVRLVSICGGVFVLAAAGVLDGRRVTTHWLFVDELRRRYPRVEVDPRALYIDEGQVLTSAGSAAGIDLCLHLVRMDHGADVANRVARRLISQPYREGGQSQFIEAPVLKSRAKGIAGVIEWLEKHLNEDLTLTEVARHAGMSERSLIRHFRAATGMSLKNWLLRERVRRSQQLLESTTLSVEAITQECGFGSPEVFRYHFRRFTCNNPTNYRQAFRAR